MSEAGTPSTQSFWSGLITPEAVYGTILVGGIVVGAGAVDATAWHTFVATLSTVLVFWSAHVYAGTIAAHGEIAEEESRIGPALQRSIHRSLGFLTSAVLPMVVLLFGALKAIPDELSMWIALWLGVIILGVIGYSAFTLRKSSVLVRILGCVGTAAFGIAIIAMKALIH